MKEYIQILFLLFFYNSVFGQYLENDRKLIVGTWIHEEGTTKFVFSANKCIEYYKGKISYRYRYKISNTSPQCDEEVTIDENRQTSYLELENLKDGSKTCYEINGFTDKTLSLTGVGYADPNLYIRQGKDVELRRKNKKH